MKHLGQLLREPSFLDQVQTELAKRPHSWSRRFAADMIADLRRNPDLAEGLGELFEIACQWQSSWKDTGAR